MVAKNRFSRALIVELFSLYYRKPLQDNPFAFVKIILLKSDNCALTLRKRLFCDAKPTLLPCKTAAFGMQNNRFCKALIISLLYNRYCCEKYLHHCCLFLPIVIRCIGEMEREQNPLK